MKIEMFFVRRQLAPTERVCANHVGRVYVYGAIWEENS